jgi:hypothetical protein
MQRTLPTATDIPRLCTIFWQFVNFSENESCEAHPLAGREASRLFQPRQQPPNSDTIKLKLAPETPIWAGFRPSSATFVNE